MSQIVSITSKGQATIPKELRERYCMKDKAIVTGTAEGILFRPLPSPGSERGSLKGLLGGMTAGELVEEAREHEEEG